MLLKGLTSLRWPSTPLVFVTLSDASRTNERFSIWECAPSNKAVSNAVRRRFLLDVFLCLAYSGLHSKVVQYTPLYTLVSEQRRENSMVTSSWMGSRLVLQRYTSTNSACFCWFVFCEPPTEATQSCRYHNVFAMVSVGRRGNATAISASNGSHCRNIWSCWSDMFLPKCLTTRRQG